MMNKLVLLFLICSFAGMFHVSAAMDPSRPYCERMGYHIEILNETSYCVFNDADKCEQWKFYNGECGADKIKPLPCVPLGEPVFQGESCCEGGKSYLPPYTLGQTSCRPIEEVEEVQKASYLKLTLWFLLAILAFVFVIYVISKIIKLIRK
ncbi:MAG: DUF333 domain-containing protein [Nanoarchaeota archaeon]|nr:DUF333 domain-containing protein [Nanoarchaeota archaeon]